MTKLITEAMKAREKAYAPYSKFKVGCAILAESGELYSGCNIENSSYSLSICAERVAVAKAITNGDLKFKRMVVVGGNESERTEFSDYCQPCGACLQVLAEFVDKDNFEIVLAKNFNDIKKFVFKDLMPITFSLNI